MGVPQPPYEVWTRIATFRCKLLHTDADDDNYLWLNVRHISRAFGSAVETCMIRRYLRRAYVTLAVDGDADLVAGSQDEEEEITSSLELTGFDTDNPRLAIPKLADVDHTKEILSMIMNFVLEGKVDVHRKLWKAPGLQHTLQFKRRVHELPLIGLCECKDTEDYSIMFDWRAMFTVWFHERREMAQIDCDQWDSNSSWMEDLKPGLGWRCLNKSRESDVQRFAEGCVQEGQRPRESGICTRPSEADVTHLAHVGRCASGRLFGR